MRNTSPAQTLLNKVASAKVDKTFFAEPWRSVVLTAVTDNGADASVDLTVQVKGSIVDDEPDFGSAAGEDNQWGYLQVKDLDDGSTNDGGVGYVSTAEEVKTFEVNTNGMRYITAEVTSHTSGRVTVIARGYDNQ